MTWFIPLLLAISVFITLLSVGIGLDRMRHYMPVLAKLVRSDYPKRERYFDRENDESLWLKRVSMRMEFETADGQSICTSHKRWMPHGYEEKPCYSIWYHCEAPEKTTAYGPGFWLTAAMVSAIVGVMVMLDPAAWLEAFGLSG